MFDRDIRIYGQYATHLKSLARDPKNPEHTYIFDRYIDVYMNAAIIGLLEGEPIDDPNYTSEDSAQILASAFLGEHYRCIFIYRLVMLLDKSTELTDEERIDRAFRDESDESHPEKLEKNMKLFRGYVLAGIEYMYAKIARDYTSLEDMCNAAYNMMKDFQDTLEE